MSNDPFADHGIDHLSPSSINAYISDPCIWIMRYLYGFRNGGGPAMWRGTCVDHAVGHMYGLGVIDKPLLKRKPYRRRRPSIRGYSTSANQSIPIRWWTTASSEPREN